MKKLNPYLSFNGNCEEALRFYKDALNGEYNIMRFGDAPGNYPPGYENKVMHARFEADDFLLMASDTMPDRNTNSGDQVWLSLDFQDSEEQEKVFNKLSQGGKVTMPLQDTFWGARFGMLADKYGIYWMLNHTKEQQQ